MASSRVLAAVLTFTLSAITATMAAAVPETVAADPKCHGLDCPKYTVTNKTNTWELRHYGETKWAAINDTGMHGDDVTHELFNALFQYISGKNAKGVKIAMTAPVVTRITHGPGPTCESSFTMHFMIPYALQAAPIAPTDSRVFLATLPPIDVFVRSFGGFASDQDYQENVAQLAQDIAKVSKFEDKYFFTAGYDGPYTFLNRHNEVWIAKL